MDLQLSETNEKIGEKKPFLNRMKIDLLFQKIE